MNVDITVGNAIEIVSILGMGTALLWRAAAVTFELKEVRKDLNELKPHGVSVPLLTQRVDGIASEMVTMRTRQHELANHMQYALGRLEEIAPAVPREPSRPDLTVDPGRPRR